MSVPVDAAPIRFGLIGIDSPHAPSFTRLMGDGVSSRVPGGTVISAWPGNAAADFPLSRDRMAGFAEQLADLGVPLRATAEEVAEECDALLLVASDARTHAGYFARLARFGKPIYVDTRFALAASDAVGMLDLAKTENCLALAGSPKRFTPEFLTALGRNAGENGRIEEIHLQGALPTQPGHPGLAWYGFHLVDLAVAALGPGCSEVDASGERVVLQWEDGRRATLGGPPEWGPLTSGDVTTAHSESRFEIISGEDMLLGLLEAVVAACRTGVPAVSYQEILETVAIVEAANKSLATGLPVAL